VESSDIALVNRVRSPYEPATEWTAIPTPLGRRVLLFAFVALAEYWVAPLLFDVTNYAGEWSAIGVVLFGFFATVLVVFVLWPLRAHLAKLTRRNRVWFHALWSGSLLVSLVVTNTLQWTPPLHASGPTVTSPTTVYTPFGAWTSLAFTAPSTGFSGTLNVEVVTIFGLLAVLWAAAVILAKQKGEAACPRPEAPVSSWRARIAPAVVFGPLGFLTGCPSCAPAYLALLAAVAPGTAASGYSAVPLVPWIGFAGLLYLVSFGLAVYYLGRVTRPREGSTHGEAPGDRPE
jgi:hypothetical protein